MNDFMYIVAPANYSGSGVFTFFVNTAGTPYKVNIAAATDTIVDTYNDANDWDANVGSWRSASD